MNQSPQPLNFLEVLAQTKTSVWPFIQKYLVQSLQFPEFCQIDPKYQPELDFHQQIISDYPTRQGKYLRPTLVVNTALSMGESLEKVIPVAAAMQLSEEWILIHDDIEDDSLERRGAPTLHRQIGKELALNAGDSLHVIMWKMIFDYQNPKITEEFYHLLNRTTFGQTIDINWTKTNKTDLTDEDVLLILESKTCYYTISGPMRLGAIVAGASVDQLNQIYLFGRYLGRAFQIIDDVLDLTSDFSGLKKQPFNDLYEGKRTIILSHLLRTASPSEKKEIIEILSKTRDQKSEVEVNRIFSLITQYHSLDYAKELAQQFAAQAKKILSDDLGFIKVEPYRHQLEMAIDFIINRQH
ncbi:MAG TPA: polyprenyl synthetase family protein [Candidatus Woesebacteria bacterium]|mgnify:FL=1|nr:polyprenyl synthetase family protein [Candidatus Woesebacteria bacterium]